MSKYYYFKYIINKQFYNTLLIPIPSTESPNLDKLVDKIDGAINDISWFKTEECEIDVKPMELIDSTYVAVIDIYVPSSSDGEVKNFISAMIRNLGQNTTVGISPDLVKEIAKERSLDDYALPLGGCVIEGK